MATARFIVSVCLLGAFVAIPTAQQTGAPSARLVPTSRYVLPDDVDSNVPMMWDLVNGTWRLFALASYGGVPSLLSGTDLTRLRPELEAVEIAPHPGHGVWMEAVVADEQGTWYGYYHHERPAESCGRPDRAVARIGAARSTDRGRTWEDLGPIIDPPAGSYACASGNSYILGGVGDVSVMLDSDKKYLYLFYSEYSRMRSGQGVAIARLPWAYRDRPVGRVAVWRETAWLNARWVPFGSPLVPVTAAWHDGDDVVDAFWGPSVHWNTYLECYVMMLNRAKNENFDNEGIYVSYARTLDDPAGWSAPVKLMNGGAWYPLVVGLEPGGTDKQAGQRARFFLMGRSDYLIEFVR